MGTHLLLQTLNLPIKFRQRLGIAFGQFFNTGGQALTESLHLTINLLLQTGHPFILKHQLLHLLFGEGGVEIVEPLI